ncbi:(2Fe-2S)-binding protein [Vibrio sp. SCSIO 43137]|uniref:(2Fe-2S)-binding protein n=1 Tax=Vibrio sp. SCSIO 43137 TaxID=3021011 RepID=UPI0023071277|nr:(2Fe-2S)-binding protein [Vibrio sp. SCSIO 43137]WCE30080.1 (2Fe-2S)-binding protein [Vibrio sp. SCSIO 43137]
MFRVLSTAKSDYIPITINGTDYQVPQGISVWTALALHDQTITRLAPVTEQKRSAYCAMGVCFECLVEIDGMPNQQACMKTVVSGMVICRQQITEATVSDVPE